MESLQSSFKTPLRPSRKENHDTRPSAAAIGKPILIADNIRDRSNYGYVKPIKKVYETNILNDFLIYLSYLEPAITFPFKIGMRGIIVIYDKCATIIGDNKHYNRFTTVKWRPRKN